jgi:hypothetical protein
MLNKSMFKIMIRSLRVSYKKLLLLLPILGITACSEIPGITITNPSSQNSALSSDFQGVWEGRGYQYDTSQSWTIKTTIVGNQYKIDYPSLRCGGDLILLNRTANKLEYRERLTYGNSCISNGKTVLTKTNANTLKFVWYNPDGSKGADGTLTRN